MHSRGCRRRWRSPTLSALVAVPPQAFMIPGSILINVLAGSMYSLPGAACLSVLMLSRGCMGCMAAWLHGCMGWHAFKSLQLAGFMYSLPER